VRPQAGRSTRATPPAADSASRAYSSAWKFAGELFDFDASRGSSSMRCCQLRLVADDSLVLL